jgi:hypothetical protein
MQAGAAPYTPAGGASRPLRASPRPEGRAVLQAGGVAHLRHGQSHPARAEPWDGHAGVRASVVPPTCSHIVREWRGSGTPHPPGRNQRAWATALGQDPSPHLSWGACQLAAQHGPRAWGPGAPVPTTPVRPAPARRASAQPTGAGSPEGRTFSCGPLTPPRSRPLRGPRPGRAAAGAGWRRRPAGPAGSGRRSGSAPADRRAC